jgi:hypothetical protein
MPVSTICPRTVAVGWASLLVSLPTGAVHAQMNEVFQQLTFREVDAVTGVPVAVPNGILEPGEAALISLSASFTPPVGSVLPTLPPGGGVYSVHALANMMIDVLGFGEASGTWTGLQLKPGWEAFPLPWPASGAPSSTGHSVYTIIPYQLAVGADTSNPVENVWQGIWRPAQYSPRTVGFRTWPMGANGFEVASSLWIHDSSPPESYGRAPAWTNIGQVSFPIVPAPGSGALLAAAVVVLHVRRRRR